MPSSNYETYSQSRFNQSSYYPLGPLIHQANYRPVDQWTGRLIVSRSPLMSPTDEVFFEVHNAPSAYAHWVGRVVSLGWQPSPETQSYVKTVSQSVRFSQNAEESQNSGNLHPDRLDQATHVGPLESLAAARRHDDVIVALRDPVVIDRAAYRLEPSLKNGLKSGLEYGLEYGQGGDRLLIDQEPVQVVGRLYALVSIIKRESEDSDRFVVRHFNRLTRHFDGRLETILIPQVPPSRSGVARSTNAALEQSPFNAEGWYVYGAHSVTGTFVVQAIAPRALFTLQPGQVLTRQADGLRYIRRDNWRQTAQKKGTGWTTLLSPRAVYAPNTSNAAAAVSEWQEGDRAIVIHLFGGIGGERGEPTKLGVVTGHFAYGLATVVREPLADELRFEIDYHQIYAHNPDGIVSGKVRWEAYMGDLQRGWLGNRPVSDVLVKLDAITEPYDFDGLHLSPLDEFAQQLAIMMARYRVGDGTGAAVVTPATSCVQDSNQALYVTIKRFEHRVNTSPAIQHWLQHHAHHPQTQRLKRLIKLGRSLERQLAPLGVIRRDWQRNAQTLTGTRPASGWLATLRVSLLSWQTLLPRRAHDTIAQLLLKQGAALWFIRTNQIGGHDPTIEPVAPTVLLR
ncbi:MAG TPA: hypothetical protein V6C88_04510 [Chroococcidiopsis sp.]